MTFLTHNLNVRKGDTLSCKYPKHGRLNILKRHVGVVEDGGVGVRNLRQNAWLLW